MEPKVWGKYIWTSIHILALGYPDKPSNEDIQNYKQFFLNFWKVIPCYKCSQNYLKHLEELPIDNFMTDNLSLFKWTVGLHNIVNKELGKREFSYEEAYEKFRKIAKGEGEDVQFVSIDSRWDKMIWWFTVSMIVIVLIIVIRWTIFSKLFKK
jgi:hypothetical protein